jgi:sulfonate transport system substrate-binding protein
MKKKRNARPLCLFAASWCVGMLLAGVASADPLVIRVGWQGAPEKLMPMIEGRRDIAPHEGTSYIVNAMHFGASSAEITALATGDLNLATLGYSSYGLAIANAHMDDLRIVADVYQDGVPGYFSTQLMVLKDAGIKTIDDLRGRVLAANGPGSGGDMAIREMLRKHGMEEKKDYTLIAGPANNQFSMLAERKADLVTISVAQASDPQVENAATTLFRVRDALGTTQWSLYAMRKSFIDANRAQLADFFEDLLRVNRWMLDPANRSDVIKIFAAFTKEAPDSFATYLFTKHDLYSDPDCNPNLAALQSNLTVMHDLGFLKTEVEVKSHADLSLIADAKNRIK